MCNGKQPAALLALQRQYQPKPSCSGTMIAIAVSSAKNTTRHTRLPHTTRNCLEPTAAATRENAPGALA